MKMAGWVRAGCLALTVGVCAGQARAQLAVYGMFSGGHFSGDGVGATSSAGTIGSYNALGGTAGLYFDFKHAGPLSIGIDARYFNESSSNVANDPKLRGGLGGIRFAFKLPKAHLRPYAQFEIGGLGTNYGKTGPAESPFLFQGQFGVDVAVYKRFDLRGEFGTGKSDALISVGSPARQSLQQYGGGVVYRFF